jgi:hypothetical protein
MNATFIKHNDPGHGWLEVTPSDLKDVGLTVDDISGYSYKNKRGTRLFLEEDCDLSTFFRAYQKKNGSYPTTVESYDDDEFPESLGTGGHSFLT